jgi:hypothetical protein
VRKLIQIMEGPNSLVYGLCDDGTFWFYHDRRIDHSGEKLPSIWIRIGEEGIEPGPMDEADLNRESCNAAAHYIQERKLALLSMDEQQRAANYLAHGFYMGARWMENGKK